MTMESSINTGV